VLAAGVALGALLLYVIAVLAPHAAEKKDFGFSLGPAEGRLLVTDVRQDGPANGLLQPGDVVLGWNGDEGIQDGDAASYFYRQAAAPFSLTIERDGERRQVALTPAVISNPAEPARTIILACIAAAWAALGLAVIALRPKDRASRLCAAFMILMAASQFGISLADIDRPVGAVQTWIRLAGFAAYPWHIVFAFLMAGAVAGIALPFSKTVIVAAAAIYTIASAPRVLHLLNPDAVATIADVTRGWQGVVGRFVIVSGLFATIASLTLALRRSDQQITRRRIGWMVAGIAPAGIAYATSAALSVAARTWPELEPVYDRALLATLFLSLTVPLAFAYAVARHELFGVRIVIRMSIQYALARSALLWMLAIPAIGLLWTIWRQPELTVRGLLSAGTPHFYLLIVIAFSLASRERLLAAIDRRFFRDARDRERILLELASEIGRTETIEDAVALAEHALDASLHPSTARVGLYDGGRPFPADLPTIDTPMLRRLEAGEEIQSDHAEIAIVVPILNRDRRLIGTMSLGSKRSEEPYSANDRQLLRAMALQIAMAVENAALRREVGDERRIRHEVLSRLDRNAVHVIRECPRCGTVFDHDAEICPEDHSALVPTLPVDRTIGGRYRLDRLIGRGAMGAVYEAADLSIKRLVAVKILQAECFGDNGALRRFEREARILGSLSQPNVVTVHDHGSLSAGGAYLVMERLYGSTWRAALRERGTIEPRTLRVWLNQLCDALVAAHGKGVVHRDLKPENIIILDGDRTALKVLDFGIAKQTSGQGDTDGTSVSGMVIGTPGYMAPEQLAGKTVDSRADIFAVGVMAWEALCGSRPFQGTTAAELAIAMQTPPVAPSGAFSFVLRDVLESSLSSDPRRRPASALELKQRLGAAISD
jgi:tRNA A-37 threonylcarbamoyl transferase component Bud32